MPYYLILRGTRFLTFFTSKNERASAFKARGHGQNATIKQQAVETKQSLVFTDTSSSKDCISQVWFPQVGPTALSLAEVCSFFRMENVLIIMTFACLSMKNLTSQNSASPKKLKEYKCGFCGIQ